MACPPSVGRGTYQPRAAERSLLHTIVREHLESFLSGTARHANGAGVPRVVEQAFRDFLTCGVLAHGCARVRCGTCAFERLVPCSCKGRGFCPSCGGRRMTERAAHLVDGVLPRVPVRQWVLTVPPRLRYPARLEPPPLPRRAGRLRAGAAGFPARRQARGRGIRDGHAGSVTVIQRFGGGLNLNVQFHTRVLDGVFTETETAVLHVHPAPPPSDAEVARLLATIRTRVRRLLARRGLEPPDEGVTPPEPLAKESLALEGISRP